MPQLSLHTPLGDLTVSEEDGAIVALDWGRGRDQDADTPAAARPRPAAGLFRRHADGIRPAARPARHAPSAARSGTRCAPSRRARPASYLDIARQVGCRAPRAIGQANGANPIPILIPCHRVVAADGSLGGYSGGEGAATKRYLLDLERAAPGADTLFTAATDPGPATDPSS